MLPLKPRLEGDVAGAGALEFIAMVPFQLVQSWAPDGSSLGIKIPTAKCHAKKKTSSFCSGPKVPCRDGLKKHLCSMRGPCEVHARPVLSRTWCGAGNPTCEHLSGTPPGFAPRADMFQNSLWVSSGRPVDPLRNRGGPKNARTVHVLWASVHSLP